MLKKIFDELQKESYQIFGTQEFDDDLLVKELENVKNFYIGEVVPRNSYKEIFFPVEEKVLEFEGKNIKENYSSEKRAIFGARFFDLKALALYDEVFKNDPYYNKRREKIFVLGYDKSCKEPKDKRDFTEKDLDYTPFDIFINCGEVLCKTKKGKEFLEKIGIKKYKEIKHLGNISSKDKEDAKRFNLLFKELDNHKLWKELGEICLACGKCTIACPTCFCFDFKDDIAPEKSCRNRIWGSCFYQDFTKISGGYVFKDKIADRIKFWYMHKFLRIPRDYGMVGCVGCERCSKVCPVEINIRKNLKKLGVLK